MTTIDLLTLAWEIEDTDRTLKSLTLEALPLMRREIQARHAWRAGDPTWQVLEVPSGLALQCTVPVVYARPHPTVHDEHLAVLLAEGATVEAIARMTRIPREHVELAALRVRSRPRREVVPDWEPPCDAPDADTLASLQEHLFGEARPWAQLLREEQTQVICELARHGWTDARIAAATGSPASTVSHRRSRAGVPAGKRPRVSKRAQAGVDEVVVTRLVAGLPVQGATRQDRAAAALLLAEEGLSPSAIAHRLRTDSAAVRRVLASGRADELEAC